MERSKNIDYNIEKKCMQLIDFGVVSYFNNTATKVNEKFVVSYH